MGLDVILNVNEALLNDVKDEIHYDEYLRQRAQREFHQVNQSFQTHIF
jgi:hypothetical protein